MFGDYKIIHRVLLFYKEIDIFDYFFVCLVSLYLVCQVFYLSNYDSDRIDDDDFDFDSLPSSSVNYFVCVNK